MNLAKYSCQSILDLALIVPKSYKSYTLSDSLEFNKKVILDVKVISAQSQGRVFKVYLFAKNLNIYLNAVFFNYSKYHINLFTHNKELFLEGKIEYRDSYQMNQPKEVKKEKISKIEIKYPKRNSSELREFILEHLTFESLKSYDFSDSLINSILKIHNPDNKFVLEYEREKALFGKYLQAVKFLEAYNYILKLKSKKRDFESTKELNNDITPFIKNLPFKLTDDQSRAIEDIKKDLAGKKSAKRIVVGDVGSGKTVLILASSLITYPNHSILMAPTTILVNQIYSEAKKLLPSFMKILLLTADSKDEDLSKYHFIIGTHKLLYQELPKADLIMVDEQHRFGTNQRKLLESLVLKDEKKPHFLQFSATPIPRTKAMLDANLIDFSFLKQTPFKKDIKTKIVTSSEFPKMLEHIKSEIEQNRQVVIVYPLVEESEKFNYLSIEEAKEFWQKRFKRVFVTFGKDKNKDRVLNEFRENGDILLSTTVIEVGISLPRLSTIIISGAERLGFASLHQLRGRVARVGLKGYCYLFTKQKSKRLEEFCKTTNGFEIAELDLKYRDSGDLLTGSEQSGKTFKFLDLAKDEKIIQNATKALES